MAVNATDYSALEDAVKATIVAAIGIGGTTPYVPLKAIRFNSGEVTLDPESIAEWCLNRHGPHIVIGVEGITDEEFVNSGGKHPRRTWQDVEIALYLYDEALRGRGGDDSEGTRGRSGSTNAPGVYKMINDVRACLTGYVAAVHTLKWQGPFWGNAMPVGTAQGKHLWRMTCKYRGAVVNVLDTSALDDIVDMDGDFNRIGSTGQPDVENLTTL